jgi:hypothetical protein
MLIEAEALKYWLENFYGFGSWHARFWFVSYEETGGDVPEEVVEKLNYFYKLQASNKNTLCDIRELYSHVEFRSVGPRGDSFINLNDHRFGSHATLHMDTKTNNFLICSRIRKTYLPYHHRTMRP